MLKGERILGGVAVVVVVCAGLVFKQMHVAQSPMHTYSESKEPTNQEKVQLEQKLLKQQNDFVDDLKKTGKIPDEYLVMDYSGNVIKKGSNDGYTTFLAQPFAAKENLLQAFSRESLKYLRKGDFPCIFVKSDLSDYYLAIHDDTGMNHFYHYKIQNDMYMLAGFTQSRQDLKQK